MHDILEDKGYIKMLESYAGKNGEDLAAVKREAQVYLKEIYTVQHPLLQTISVQFSQFILSRGFDKTIDVNPSEVKQLSKIMRRHPVAFVMTHKTYIDMLVLAVALARHGLPIPHVFSGINMSFLGLGDLGRKSGAIFIRRSFKDNHLYKCVLKFFIARIVDEKKHFMWAIEGTRSRTGKLVWPKMGILKYIAEGDRNSSQEVKYIPVSIVYDLIPDVDQMVKEGRGKEKSQESLLWFMNYIRKMGEDFGKISIRFSDPVDIHGESEAELPIPQNQDKPMLPEFAFNLVHHINKVTPVTTGSLICSALLSQFAMTKHQMELAVEEQMDLVENHKSDALVERGTPIGHSVQQAINRFIKAGLVQQVGASSHSKYSIVPEKYLTASYYANMSAHHFYHRAFIELALCKIQKSRSKNRLRAFWVEIMQLRDLFKFEFFYSNKITFSDEIEKDMDHFDPDWAIKINDLKFKPLNLMKGKGLLLSQTVLSTYVEAYKVVAEYLCTVELDGAISEKDLLAECHFLGEEMHWKGKIHRVDSVSKPFLLNGVRFAQNKGLIDEESNIDVKGSKLWHAQLDEISERIMLLQKTIDANQPANKRKLVKIDRQIIPGSRTIAVTHPVLEGESGPHIGAFFDLDRTLISGFSAKQFFQSRLFSGKMSTKEIVAQFGGILVYALGNRNFAGLAAISAKGINGVEEKLFAEVGEEVYLKYLADEIYPESRALVEAHFAKGHTVAIISAATPYQVEPIARDLGIDHIMCTRMEVIKGKFTGQIVEPACWGEGKAIAAKNLAKNHNLDLSKSHFYTDSAEDMPLMEIVGFPHAINPDAELSKAAFENDWPITRFSDESRPGIMNFVRTGLAMSSMIPATIAGLMTGTANMSWKDGVNSMMATIGDVGVALAGIKLVVHGKENLWKTRPAVFIFNHQSNVDLLIVAKLLRKDAVGVAKKELQMTPLGPLMKAAGVIFLDRENKQKAIEALNPAVDVLKSGVSIGIAPEGTRSYDYNLGTFKKGAFHIAMAAKAPIVPIIIKNAHDVMPRGSNFIKPAVVEVVVLPAIKTNRWTLNSLDKNIKRVRDLYIEELGQ